MKPSGDDPNQIPMVYAKPAVAKPEITELEDFLKGKGWMSAEEITAETGWNDRAVRNLASKSDLLISSPGIKGYKYLYDATLEEYLNYRNGRRSQVRMMMAKVIRTDRKYYARSATSV